MTVTLEFQYNFLLEHGTKECTVTNDYGCIEYYTFNDASFRVTIIGDDVRCVDRVSKDEMHRISSCKDLDFGKW